MNENWISEAPVFEGEKNYKAPSSEFCSFLKEERKKLYKSKNTVTGEIFIIMNPAAWFWSFSDGDKLTFHRLKPQPIGEFLPSEKPKKKYQQREEREAQLFF